MNKEKLLLQTSLYIIIYLVINKYLLAIINNCFKNTSEKLIFMISGKNRYNIKFQRK